MGMTANYRHVSERAVAAMRADERLVAHVHRYTASTGGMPAALEAMMAQMPPEMRSHLVEQWQKQMGDPALAAFFAKSDADARSAVDVAGLSKDDFGDILTIDKAWRGLHKALGGNDLEAGPPPANVVFGGKEIGENTGYGPPRLLDVPEVRETAAALVATSEEEMNRRTGDAEWVIEVFRDVRDYFGRAAELRHAMLIFMT